jgi:hypothetical protein
VKDLNNLSPLLRKPALLPLFLLMHPHIFREVLSFPVIGYFFFQADAAVIFSTHKKRKEQELQKGESVYGRITRIPVQPEEIVNCPSLPASVCRARDVLVDRMMDHEWGREKG